MNEYPRVVQVSRMIGNKVVNPSGEVLGNLKELVLDLEEGHIAYAVLSFGGLIGVGDKLFAIPWEALMLNPKDHTFILDVEKEVLQKAPGFDKDHWPDDAHEVFTLREAGWLLDLDEYYGYSPYWMPDK